MTSVPKYFTASKSFLIQTYCYSEKNKNSILNNQTALETFKNVFIIKAYHFRARRHVTVIPAASNILIEIQSVL